MLKNISTRMVQVERMLTDWILQSKIWIIQNGATM